MKKKLLYVTGSRAEYGIMKRLLLSLSNDSQIQLTIIATGMHCDARYGLTYKVIEQDGLIIDKLIPIDINSDNNSNILKSMAICQTKFGEYFEQNKFDAVMLLGDRYEIFSVAIAAAIHNMPIIHLHGGEQTLGNYDEFIRHAITKMSRLHLASTEEYRNRIIQMGEFPDTVHNIGALGAENALLMNLPTKYQLQEKFGSLVCPYFMVVFHPETLNNIPLIDQVEQLLSALERLKERYEFIFIGSNSDTGSDKIIEKIKCFCEKNAFRLFTSVTPEEYLSLNKYSQGLIGNSSSGLIEIPALKIPTINIGNRQKGRVRGNTVIDCQCNTKDIFNAILSSQKEEFLNGIRESVNPYYKTNVLEAALRVIKDYMNSIKSDYKDFYDMST